MVVREARRLLPALARACFATSNSLDDRMAAEVRSVLTRAWMSKHPEHGDPFADPALPLATPRGSRALDEVQPWDMVKALLRMHVASCKVRRAHRNGFEEVEEILEVYSRLNSEWFAPRLSGSRPSQDICTALRCSFRQALALVFL